MRLSYSKRALAQIDKALGYVARRSPSGAANIEVRMTAILRLMQIQPLAGLRTRAAGFSCTPYPFLIDYQIGDDEITVLRFRHTSRDAASIPDRA